MNNALFQKTRLSGFTLVELIVTIAIIAILATVTFVGYSNYSSSARDSRKLSNVQSIFRSLNTYRSAQLVVPLPDSPSIELKYEGNSLSHQWVVANGVLSKIGMGDTVLDLSHVDGYYVLLTNRNRNFVQLGIFLENEGVDIASWALSWIAPSAYAASGIDFARYIPYVYGEKLGIVLSTEEGKKNMPIQETTTATSMDLSTGNTVYKVIIANSNSSSASGVYVGTGAQLMACDKPIESNYKCGTRAARDFSSESDNCVERTLTSFNNDISKCRVAIAHAGTGVDTSLCINYCQIPASQLIFTHLFDVIDASPSTSLVQGGWTSVFQAVKYFSDGKGLMTVTLPYRYFSDMNGTQLSVESTTQSFVIECTATGYAFTGTLASPQCVPKDCYATFLDDYLLPDLAHNEMGTGTKTQEILHGKILTDRPISCSFGQYSVGAAVSPVMMCDSGYNSMSWSCQ